MCQVIYSSKAISGEAGGDLPDIIERSNANNPDLGITGILIVTGDTFVQLLEGPKDSVAMLLDFIRDDPRHVGMEVLLDRRMERREFGDWAMGHHEIAPGSAHDAAVAEALDAARRDRSTTAGELLMQTVADVGRAARRLREARPASSEMRGAA